MLIIFMHPLVKIILFIFTLLLMSVLSQDYLLLMCVVLCGYSAFIDYSNFLRFVKRMKWLFISIIIIFAFTTPGEYIQQFSIFIAPTKEGCTLGVLQIARLLVAISTLNLLFATCTNNELMSGLYLLLSPLNLVGLNTNKFTARLMLTLDYVEELALKKKFNFNDLDNLLSTTELYQKNKMIALENYPFRWTDKALMVVLGVSTLAVCYAKVMN